MEPRTVLAVLADTHVEGIEPLDAEIALRQLMGEAMDTIAGSLPMAKSTAYRRTEAMFTKVFARAGIAPSHRLEGAWCALHIRCCLRRR